MSATQLKKEVMTQLATRIMNIEEVADFLEKGEVTHQSNHGAFDVLRVTHPSIGTGILISSHCEEHLLIHL